MGKLGPPRGLVSVTFHLDLVLTGCGGQVEEERLSSIGSILSKGTDRGRKLQNVPSQDTGYWGGSCINGRSRTGAGPGSEGDLGVSVTASEGAVQHEQLYQVEPKGGFGILQSCRQTRR